MEDYIKNNYEVFDRFTFDHLYRNLLADGYDYEEAKDIIMTNCALSALVLQERIHNEYYYRISVDEKISKDLIEFMNEIAEEIMTLKGKEYERFCDYLNNKIINPSDNFQNGQKVAIENEFFDNTDNLYNNKTYEGYTGEIQTIYGQLQKTLGVKIHPARDTWDRTYNVDFYIQVNDKYIGLQIKPISSGMALDQYQWDEIQESTHKNFTNKFGGKVFFVFSIKVGNKKKIHNTEVISEIEEEIKKYEK